MENINLKSLWKCSVFPQSVSLPFPRWHTSVSTAGFCKKIYFLRCFSRQRLLLGWAVFCGFRYSAERESGTGWKIFFHTKRPCRNRAFPFYIRSGAACLLRNFFPERSTMRRSGHSSCLHPCKTGRIYYSGGRKQRWYHSRGNSPRDPIPRNSHNLSWPDWIWNHICP